MMRLKKLNVALLTLAFAVMLGVPAKAQDARSLIKEGAELSNAHNYNGAIEKYKAALQLEPDNATANYQLAFSLNATGKGQEALPYLQKVTQSTASAQVRSSAYGLMGGIFDQSKQAKQAIDSYQKGIQIDSGSYAMQYGLGLAYFRNHQYAQAEQSAISALQLDAGQADDAFRLYGLVAFHQDKRVPALLGFCSYLALQPNGAKSDEVYGNLQSILQGGDLKPEPGVARPRPDASTLALNRIIAQSVTAMATRRYITAADQLSAQLQAIFTGTGALAQKQAGQTFFKMLIIKYARLAQTEHMPTFARYIRQGTDPTAAAWLKTHTTQVTALEGWMKENKIR